MVDENIAGRNSDLPRAAIGCTVVLLLTLAANAAGAPRTTNFVHSVGFSFDYPSKWGVKSLDEGLLLVPHDADRDASGRSLEVIVIDFIDVDVTDPFDPSFADAFERQYRSLVPELRRSGDMDWLQTSMGLGMLIPFEDRFGNPHQVFGVVHGQLGILLAHFARSGVVRSKGALVREIFASFNWTESVVDPALVRAWTDVPPETARETSDRWVFAGDGRLRRAAGEPERGGFYSSSSGVLNIVWDHGTEESYLYTVSKQPEGGVQLELQSPDGNALRLH